VIGTLLNQYRLDEVIGQGGMGVVYRALDTNLERVVAVKVLSSTLRDDPEFVARFRQEARIQAGLNHPNIATLFDFFIWNDLPVAVMELIKGETLRSLVDRTGPVPAHIALPIFVQALRGVAAGHKLGIIHRDLKPSNLMITEEGVVKITDFGIAKVRNNSGQTRVSTRVGSASYMAPEQILGRPVDEKTDIYIMGGTLYELLTGRPPFQGLSQFEIDSAHVREAPKLPTEFIPDIPPAAVAAVMKALAKEPADRFATAEEFIQALPDLQGVPYVAPAPGPVDDDATRVGVASPEDVTLLPPPAVSTLQRPLEGMTLQRPLEGVTLQRPLEDATLLQPAEDVTQLPEPVAKLRNARGVATAVAASAVLGLLVTGVLLLWSRPQARTDPASLPTGAASPLTGAAASPPTGAASMAVGSAVQAAEPISPPNAPVHDLTGTWSGTYLDGTGQPRLKLQNLQLQQLANDDVTGRFTLESGELCTLEKSTWSPGSKHLRLVTHCHNPDHPKYLNVPLEFNNVDPTANTIGGGRLDFHLADDIVVTLERDGGA
jgi:Protein kinase domain